VPLLELKIVPLEVGAGRFGNEIDCLGSYNGGRSKPWSSTGRYTRFTGVDFLVQSCVTCELTKTPKRKLTVQKRFSAIMSS
jgi:hypothetical protein